MPARIVPLHLVRNAVQQSARMGIDEPRQTVVDRVLGDLRDPHHPAIEALYALHDFRHVELPARAPRGAA